MLCLLTLIRLRHTNAFSFENEYFFFSFPHLTTLIRSKTEVYVRAEVFENAFWSGSFGKRKFCILCGPAKTEVMEVFDKRLRQSRVRKSIIMARYLAFGVQVRKVENAAKRLVWTKNVLSVFKKQKTEDFKSALVWTGPWF